jgi:hypothetical protein
LEYRLSTFATSKFHVLDDKFDRLYEELNKRMNSLSYEVTSNLEERKNELAKLKNFVLEENHKVIENVKVIKNDMSTEFDLIQTNFKKINKNIISLANLLMGRAHNLNKQLVINNFNNMMLDLFKEYNVIESLEVKKSEIQQAKAFKKSGRHSVASCIKQYIEGKISVNDARFHGEKAGSRRKKSLQLTDKMLLAFNKDEAQQTLTSASNKNNNNKNDNSANKKKKTKSRFSQIITFNPNTLEKNFMAKTEPKKSKKIDINKDISQFKIESINNTNERTNTTNKKKLNNNDVISEEDSNKYNSSKSSNNSFESKNKKKMKKEKVHII